VRSAAARGEWQPPRRQRTVWDNRETTKRVTMVLAIGMYGSRSFTAPRVHVGRVVTPGALCPFAGIHSRGSMLQAEQVGLVAHHGSEDDVYLCFRRVALFVARIRVATDTTGVWCSTQL
jgi:hypothetical protein